MDNSKKDILENEEWLSYRYKLLGTSPAQQQLINHELTTQDIPPLQHNKPKSNADRINKALTAAATDHPTKENSLKKMIQPSTFLNYENKSVIVIDPTDIDESTKDANIEIVDPPNPTTKLIDFHELVGKDWPALAGTSGELLNNTFNNNNDNASCSTASSSSTSYHSHQQVIYSSNKRNKSLNPISHILKQRDHTSGNSIDSTIIERKENDTYYDNAPPTSSNNAFKEKKKPQLYDRIPNTSLTIESMIEIMTNEYDENLHAVIKWIGKIPGHLEIKVGAELESRLTADAPIILTDGKFYGQQLFKCPPGKGILVNASDCLIDRRFNDVEEMPMYGERESSIIPGRVPHLKITNSDALKDITGSYRGIQGTNNSCYLDATLFAMFTFTHVFDSLLFREPRDNDIVQYNTVRTILKDEIINPLRKEKFVRADHVLKLRTILSEISSTKGLTSEEKDPEEFLNILMIQILKADPLLKLNSGQESFFYQLFVEKDEKLKFPTVQKLFEQSFHASNIKLLEVPKCLVIQMPRFGKSFKMYPRILPSHVLDVTDIIEGIPRDCIVCSNLAKYECLDCYDKFDNTSFCENCIELSHKHEDRRNHNRICELKIPNEYLLHDRSSKSSVPKIFMELFAVVCIETSHYVSFVKAGPGADAPWVFFDSMSDRIGDRNGYNIPSMISVPELQHWLTEEGATKIHLQFPKDKLLPELAKRLFCDAYMCMYQSNDTAMYN